MGSSKEAVEWSHPEDLEDTIAWPRFISEASCSPGKYVLGKHRHGGQPQGSQTAESMEEMEALKLCD